MMVDNRMNAVLVMGFALLVAAVVAIVHWPVLDAQAMCFDDEEAIVENHLVQNPSWHSVGRFFSEVTLSSVVVGYYRPLTLTSLMLDWAMGGRPDNLRAFHRSSLALHVGSTVLIILLCYQIFKRPIVAAMVGLLFGLHPMTVEPIAWVMERKTILAAIFAFGCMNAYVRYTQIGGKRWYIASVVLYLISLLAKPTVTPLPVLLLLMDYWPLKRFNRRAIIEKIPFFILAVVFALLCMLCEQKVNPLRMPAKLSLLHLPLRLCWLMVFYPFKILLPIRLTPVYVLPEPLALSNGVVLLAVVLVAAVAAILILYRRRLPALWVSAAIFYIGLSPTMGFVGYSWVKASDKYTYFPAVGLLLLLAWLLGLLAGAPTKGRASWRPSVVVVGVLAIALWLGVGTRQYIEEWQSTERHKFYMLSMAPNSSVTHFCCGNVYFTNGQYDKAIDFFTRSIELRPDDMQTYYNRGITYSRMQEYEKAIRDLTMVAQRCPTEAYVFNSRGKAFTNVLDYASATRDFDHAIALDPDFADAYNNRGLVYRAMQDVERAFTCYNKAIELAPDFAEAYFNRGNVCLHQGDYQKATEDYDKAIEYKSGYAAAYHDRAVAHAAMSDYDNAWADIAMCKKLGLQVNPVLIKRLARVSSRPQPE